MARVFTDGAEMGDTLFWTYPECTAVTADPVPSPSAYCYRNAGTMYKSFSALSEFYFRERLWLSYARAQDTNWRIPAFYNGSTELLRLSITDTGRLYVSDSNGSTLAVGSQVLNSSQWYLLEMRVKIDDAPNGVFNLYIDAVEDIDFTGDTKTTAYTTVDTLYYRAGASLGGGHYMGVDDLALNDTTGGVDDSWCGDGVIIKVTPNGNGTTNDWHGSDGDSIDNYALVDDFPSDGDTTYSYHNGADSGVQDQYALSDYNGTDKTILRIYPEARIRKTAAAAHTVKLGTLASGGADAMSAAMNLTTSYARYVGNEQKVNPVDSNPWEEADIDALEFVAEVG